MMINTINTKELISRNVVVTFSSPHIIMDLNVLCLLLSSSLGDSNPEYPVFVRVNGFLFRAGLVISPVTDVTFILSLCLKLMFLDFL